MKGGVAEPISTNRGQSMTLASVAIRQCNLSDLTHLTLAGLITDACCCDCVQLISAIATIDAMGARRRLPPSSPSPRHRSLIQFVAQISSRLSRRSACPSTNQRNFTPVSADTQRHFSRRLFSRSHSAPKALQSPRRSAWSAFDSASRAPVADVRGASVVPSDVGCRSLNTV
jgi:hypothetical protein